MNNLMMFSLVAAAAGLAAGLLLPMLSEKLSAWKCGKKGREFAADPRFTSALTMLACSLVNGLGWGLCWDFGSAAAAPAVLAALIWSLGVVLIVVDLRLRLIPNEVLLWMLILGVPMEVMLRGFGSLFGCVFASMMVFCLFATLGKAMGLYKIGAGDVKLAMVMTMTLGYPTVLTGMLGMAGSLLVFTLGGLLLRKLTLKTMLPLGPFIVPGYWVGLVVLLRTMTMV